MIGKLAEKLRSHLWEGATFSLPAMPTSAEALIVLALTRITGKTVMWIGDGARSLETFHRDLLTLSAGSDHPLLYYPPWDSFPLASTDGKKRKVGATGLDLETAGQRLRVLGELALPSPLEGEGQPRTFGAGVRGKNDRTANITLTPTLSPEGRGSESWGGIFSPEGRGSGCCSDACPHASKVTPPDEDPPTPGYGGAGIRRYNVESRPSGKSSGTIITTCVQALMQKTRLSTSLAENTHTLRVNDELDLAQFMDRLSKSGYSIETEVVEKGQAAVRGGIVDIWPMSATWPYRIELMGATIESIRSFDPADQKSKERHAGVVIPPAMELPQQGKDQAIFTTYLPDDVIVVWSQMDNITDHASLYEEAIAESKAADFTITLDALKAEIAAKAKVTQVFLGDSGVLPQLQQSNTSNAGIPARVQRGPAFAQLRRGTQEWQRYHQIPRMTEIPPDVVLGQNTSCSDACPHASKLDSPDVDIRRHNTSTIHSASGSAKKRFLTPKVATSATALELDIAPVDSVFLIPREALQPDVLEQARRKLISDLQSRATRGHDIVIFLDTEASIQHFREQFAKELPADVQTGAGFLSSGFTSESMRIAIISEADLYGRKTALNKHYDPEPGARRPDRNLGTRISDLMDIEPGDVVVHLEHGIGKYRGLSEIMFDGKLQEVLTIEYAEGAKLHVPVAHAHLLSRYVGMSRRRPHLHRLGGRRWSAEKAAAEHALQDLAASLLETQAQRSHLPGHASKPDTHWQHEFEASFPYFETPDQHAAIVAVKGDMESTKPMDRLVCGDAGYGKTEVAMRAAFKTVMEEKQAAILVPTTVLAQQHFDTFRERMSAYPVRIEMLSRFCTRSRQNETLKGMADGTVDIVIGTHSLLQPNVTFKDLGLVVIDEEQRFGVTHKEQLKQLRRMVDVLTLTATPIPRTLYMSFTGAKDMSLIQTPPGERMVIETIVAPNNDRLVRDAIMRELNREGQVFYLHNRVMTIEHVRERLARLTPEARIAVAHGQMPSGELSEVMESFVAGEHDVLLCTTIIESGMDIPRANTILIDRADRFGIADLYQLRGRVGRANRKAYAYLLLPSHGQIDTDARKRIGAIKQHSSLGTSFRLALRDLEIRGAGNLLGAEQSGHISAIGFGLYCQLLKRTIAVQKGEAVPPLIDVTLSLDLIALSASVSSDNAAVIPYEYIEDERLRVSAYRRMAEASSSEDVSSLRDDLRDRFGPLPTEVSRLLKITELRIAAAMNRISKVETRESKVLLTRDNDYIQVRGRFPRLTAPTPDGQLDEIIGIVSTPV